MRLSEGSGEGGMMAILWETVEQSWGDGYQSRLDLKAGRKRKRRRAGKRGVQAGAGMVGNVRA